MWRHRQATSVPKLLRLNKAGDKWMRFERCFTSQSSFPTESKIKLRLQAHKSSARCKMCGMVWDSLLGDWMDFYVSSFSTCILQKSDVFNDTQLQSIKSVIQEGKRRNKRTYLNIVQGNQKLRSVWFYDTITKLCKKKKRKKKQT